MRRHSPRLRVLAAPDWRRVPCDTPGDDIPRFGLPVLPLWASLALEGACVSVFFGEMALKVTKPGW